MSRSFEVIFPDKMLLTPNNVPATVFSLHNQNRFGEKHKKVIFTFKMAAILRDLDTLHCTRSPPKVFVSKVSSGPYNNEGARSGTKIRAHILDPLIFLLLLLLLLRRQLLQCHQEHIGPTLHVGPNNYLNNYRRTIYMVYTDYGHRY